MAKPGETQTRHCINFELEQNIVAHGVGLTAKGADEPKATAPFSNTRAAATEAKRRRCNVTNLSNSDYAKREAKQAAAKWPELHRGCSGQKYAQNATPCEAKVAVVCTKMHGLSTVLQEL